MKKVAIWLLILTGLVPLVVTRNTLSPSVDGKVLIYQIAACAVALIMCLLLAHKGEGGALAQRLAKVMRSPIGVSMAAGAALLAVSIVFAHDRFIGFFGDSSRGEGFLTLISLYVLYVAMATLFDRSAWRRFFIAIAVSGLIICVHTVWQVATMVDRPSSFIGNPIPLAGFFLFSLFAGYYLCTQGQDNKRHPLLPIIGALVTIGGIVGIFLTETRGTLLAAGAGVIVCALLAAYWGKQRKLLGVRLRSLSVGICVMALAFSALFVTTAGNPFWKSVPGVQRLAEISTESGSVKARLIFLGMTKDGFVESTMKQKIIGWGWNNYTIFWIKNYDPAVYYYDHGVADRAHNKLADMLIMTGILGLLAYIALWCSFAASIGRMLREDFALGLGLAFLGVSYFVHNLFAFDIPVILFAFYAVLAFATAHRYEA